MENKVKNNQKQESHAYIMIESDVETNFWEILFVSWSSKKLDYSISIGFWACQPGNFPLPPRQYLGKPRYCTCKKRSSEPKPTILFCSVGGFSRDDLLWLAWPGAARSNSSKKSYSTQYIWLQTLARVNIYSF